MMPTTKELAAAAEVAVNTVHRWNNQGLFHGIEKPTKNGGPGQGVRLQWPDAALERARQLARLRLEGMTIKDLQRACGYRPEVDELLVACAASVLRELAAMDLRATALATGLHPPPHTRQVGGSLEKIETLTLGLICVVRLRCLSPTQMEQLAVWLERADPAVGEYMAAVDSRSMERDQARLRQLGLQLGLDGRAWNPSDPDGPPLTWTETLRTLDALEPGLGRRHQLRFSDPTEPSAQ